MVFEEKVRPPGKPLKNKQNWTLKHDNDKKSGK